METFIQNLNLEEWKGKIEIIYSEGFELVEVGDLKVDLDKVKFNSKDKISNGAFVQYTN